MRRVVLLASGLAVAAACSQSGVTPSTRLSGTNSAVVAGASANPGAATGLGSSTPFYAPNLSGSLVFVTSTGSNELRVFDALRRRPGQEADFVRGPNPLQPLSIPTIPAPVELVTPRRYGVYGQPIAGDWVFVRGAGGSSIGIVGAVNCPQQLRQLGTITPQPSAVVTAMTARLSEDDTLASLFVATFDGQSSTLWQIDFPNVPRNREATFNTATCGAYPGSVPATAQPRAVGSTLVDRVVTALLALPTVVEPGTGARAPETRVAVGMRVLGTPPNLPGVMTEQGEIALIDTATGARDPRQPQFFPTLDPTLRVSYPVKRLVTHGNVVQLVTSVDLGSKAPPLSSDGGFDGGVVTVALSAGTRLFGVLDEASCGGQLECTGILAVDLDRPLDSAGTYPVAIEGFDNGALLSDGGLAENTFYRAPENFLDGGRRDHNRMEPVRFGGFPGVIQDLVIQSNGLLGNAALGERQYGLLGVATISGQGRNGTSSSPAQIILWDALGLRQINQSAVVAGLNDAGISGVLPGGARAIFDGGPTGVVVGAGVWPVSENIYVQYEGIVAGLSAEPLDAGTIDLDRGIWPVNEVTAPSTIAKYVQAGDILVPRDATNTECLYAFPIQATQPDGGVLFFDGGTPYLKTDVVPLGVDGGTLTFADGGSPTIVSGCPTPVSFAVRSSIRSQVPLTVTGLGSGYLGRVALPPDGGSSTFVINAGTAPAFRFWRPTSFFDQDATRLDPVGLRFDLKYLEAPFYAGDEPSLRGAGYQMSIVNGFLASTVLIDQSSLGVSGLTLPGALALYQPQFYPDLYAATQNRVFVLYPSANAILDFSSGTILSVAVPQYSDIAVRF